MRRTHKQIVEQKAQYIANRIQQNAQQMSEFKARREGGNASDYLAACLEITSKQVSQYEQSFERDFGAKTRKPSVKAFKTVQRTAREIELLTRHPELELDEIYQLGLDKNTLY